jgi:hypothetical protein
MKTFNVIHFKDGGCFLNIPNDAEWKGVEGKIRILLGEFVLFECDDLELVSTEYIEDVKATCYTWCVV